MTDLESLPLEGSGSLVGRQADIDVLFDFIDVAAVDGATLLLTGEAGVGRSRLLDEAAAQAERVGTTVIRAAGAEFESDVSYSGLNQMLTPFLGRIAHLPAAGRELLSVALGSGDGSPSDLSALSDAVLEVLRDVRASAPLLLIVDDLQWQDPVSCAVLGSVGRRLGGSGVGFLGAVRQPTPAAFDLRSFPKHLLPPLDRRSATALLEHRFPALAPRVRQRILQEAQGNPLALVELPAALSEAERRALRALPAALPLSRRLMSMFAPRITGLPTQTRDALLLAALDASGDLNPSEAATAGAVGLDRLAPAEQAGLIDLDQACTRMRFRHPLIRTTIVDLATTGECRRAHAELALLLVGRPEDHAWHLAEARSRPDESVAALLEEAAHRTQRRGDSVAAVTWHARAADLSGTPAERSRRLFQSAYLAAHVTGDLRAVAEVLKSARVDIHAGDGSLQMAVAAAYVLLNDEGEVDVAHRLLVAAIDRQPLTGGDDPMIMEALHTLLLISFFGGRSELWEPFERSMALLAGALPATLRIQASTLGDPARNARHVLDELDAEVRSLSSEADPVAIVRISMGAFFVDRLAGCRSALSRVVDDGRTGGAVASAISALMMLAIDRFWAGDWDEAERLAEEGCALADFHGYQLLTFPGLYCRALIAAARGEEVAVRRLTDQMTSWAAPRGARAVEMYSWHAKCLVALGRSDFEEAYRHACAISPAGELRRYVPHALWVTLDLVEAAMHTRRDSEAQSHAAAVDAAGLALVSPRLALLSLASAATTAPEAQRAELFRDALQVQGADAFPFERARVQLAYGEHLRRTRATKAAREPLRAARDAFRRLGATPWARRAGSELRAAGGGPSTDVRSPVGTLTPQERDIAQLAASGLTNRQIAAQLLLSPRTVSAHLYHIFPKLGISSRAALRDALEGHDEAPRRP